MRSSAGNNVRAAPVAAVKSNACKFFTASTTKSSNGGGYGGALALSRTDSQKLGALTGRSRTIARAALNAVGDDHDSAFKLLMSELALNVVDPLPCEIEPLRVGASAWLAGAGEIRSIGAFAGCSLLRIEEGRKESLQLFALEPVDVCLLTRGSQPLEDGWVELEYTELPEVVGVEAGLIMQTHKFDPGLVVVPLDAALLPPIVRVVGKRAVAPPRNSVMPRSLAAPPSEPVTAGLSEASLAPISEDAQYSGQPLGKQQLCGSSRSSTTAEGSGEPEIASGSKRYRTLNSVGKGSFGIVYLAEDAVNGRRVAMKCISQNPGYRIATREAELLGKIEHPCVVSLLDAFEEQGSNSKVIMHLVMEYLPQNLHQKIAGRPLELGHIRCFSFQLLRALAHLDGMQVCHRDLKPENVLLDHRALKLADFGSAKLMGSGPSTNYICSRWWRAPELVLGTSEYSTSVDWWSCGCVIAEMMLGRTLFQGQSSLGQIYEIMQALGTPSPEDIQAMHPRRGLGKIAEQLMKLSKLERAARPWQQLFPAFATEPDALKLPELLLMYTPSARLHPADALCSTFFACLPEADEALGPLPASLFDFTEAELCHFPLSALPREALSSFASRRAEWKTAQESIDCTQSTEVPGITGDAASSSQPNCDGETSSSEADEVGEDDVIPLRSTMDASEERRLKRRRIGQKTPAMPPPICIRLDSEDFTEVL